MNCDFIRLVACLIAVVLAGATRVGAEDPAPSEAQNSEQSPVENRRSFDDKQEAAARPDDYALDPLYRGFIPVPNTPFLIKFNPKPHLDATFDSDHSGSKNRFVPAKIPVSGDPAQGGGEEFNLNGNGTQLRVDIRAPGEPGNFRFYYQNDFFGDNDKDFRYRVQHIYGQYYNIVAGFTYGVFEDPDSWPDTVDYEGPNAVIFARRPVLHYTLSLAKQWNLTLGLEKPDIFLDDTLDPTAELRTRIPDLGFNLRWEDEAWGHAQFSFLGREIGADGGVVVGEDHVGGWGVNLSTGITLGERDSFQTLVVYGHGVGGMGNDTSFVNSDAAFKANGDLEALEYVSALLGFTHRWSEQWRSTASYGFVELENLDFSLTPGVPFSQAANAYHKSHYASGNLVYQLRKRLSVGLELLYGHQTVNDGSTGDVYRVQLGLLYSLFD